MQIIQTKSMCLVAILSTTIFGKTRIIFHYSNCPKANQEVTYPLFMMEKNRGSRLNLNVSIKKVIVHYFSKYINKLKNP